MTLNCLDNTVPRQQWEFSNRMPEPEMLATRAGVLTLRKSEIGI